MPLQGARLRQVGHDAHTVPSFPAIVAAQVRIAAVEEHRGLHPPPYHLIGEWNVRKMTETSVCLLHLALTGCLIPEERLVLRAVAMDAVL